MNRRDFIRNITLLTALASPGAKAQQDLSIKVNGRAFAPFQPWDDLIVPYMAAHDIPGGAFAYVREGRLAYARGYGVADRETQEPFTPTTLCRIGSVSKSFTAVGILKLVQEGKLRLEERAIPLTGIQPFLKPGITLDPRLNHITVRQLLQHTSGFSNKTHIGWSVPEVAAELGLPMPVDQYAIIRLALGKPLVSDPGQRWEYHNLNYLILGRVIEKVSGQSYESYMKGQILAPMGIRDMFITRTRYTERKKGEAHYYDLPDRKFPSVFPEDKGKLLPLSYGGIHYQVLDASGGWVGSVVDLARFAKALTDPSRPFLSARICREIVKRPEGVVGRESDGQPKRQYYGLGFEIESRIDHDQEIYVFHHAGAVSGACCTLLNRFDGSTMVCLFNADNESYGLIGDLKLHDAGDAIARRGEWPQWDLFADYGER